jgi:hypothetical protein
MTLAVLLGNPREIDNLVVVNRCRAKTADGTLCKNKVKHPGDRCHRHKYGDAPQRQRTPRRRRSTSGRSQSTARRPTATRQPPPSQPRPDPDQQAREREERERQERVEAAAQYCADVANQGALEATTGRIAEYVSDPTWRRLTRHWRATRCRALAALARRILAAKASYHGSFARMILFLPTKLGLHRVVAAFAEELLKNVPLPGDELFVTVGRGMQLVGISLCLATGQDLTSCACFRDMALAETKERVKSLITVTIKDWTQIPPRDSTLPSDPRRGSRDL